MPGAWTWKGSRLLNVVTGPGDAPEPGEVAYVAKTGQVWAIPAQRARFARVVQAVGVGVV